MTTDELLADLRERLETAHAGLLAEADGRDVGYEWLRLEAKATGVALALDYLRAYEELK